MNIHAVVVLYNPSLDALRNLDTYIHFVEKVYAIDNSEEVNGELVKAISSIDKVCYVSNGENLGIAHALNQGAFFALSDKADWLLTMDQDSAFCDTSLEKMVQWLGQQESLDIGILSPVHLLDKGQMCSGDFSNVRDVDTVMTSGNFLNLQAFKVAGGFNEAYFIDYVDHEYCLRLKKKNFRVCECQGAFLKHELGKLTEYHFLGLTLAVTNHSALRRYYITRNRLDFMVRFALSFPAHVFFDLKSMVVEFLKILFFEANKLDKVKMILLGSLHFIKRRYGRFDVASSFKRAR